MSPPAASLLWGVILAVAILALAATLLAGAFRCRRPLAVALASAGLFAQPYGLANLSFQFDAPLVATAELLALAAAWQGLRRPGLHLAGAADPGGPAQRQPGDLPGRHRRVLGGGAGRGRPAGAEFLQS